MLFGYHMDKPEHSGKISGLHPEGFAYFFVCSFTNFNDSLLARQPISPGVGFFSCFLLILAMNLQDLVKQSFAIFQTGREDSRGSESHVLNEYRCP